MKVLYVITRANHGGAQQHLLDLIANRPSSAHVTVACGEAGYLLDHLSKLGVQSHHLKRLVWPLNPRADLAAVRELRGLIRQVGPDVIHAHSSKAGIIARIAGRLEGVPVVYTAHGFAFAEPSARRRLVSLTAERLCGPMSARIITVSKRDEDLALQYRLAAPRRIIRIWNGVADTLHRADPSRAPATMVVVARLAAPKDLATLLRAWGAAKPDASLVTVGDGPDRRANEAMAERLELQNVQFLGAREDVPIILGSAQAFALPSLKEGLPLTILEAMAAGLPVVASDVGGVREAVTDGVTGFLVPRGDVNALAARLAQLLADPSLRARMGPAGRARYEADFRVEVMAEKTFKVYADVLAERRRL